VDDDSDAAFASALKQIDELASAGPVDDAAADPRKVLSGGGVPPTVAARLPLSIASLAFMAGKAGVAVTETEAVLASSGVGPEMRRAPELQHLVAVMAAGGMSCAQRFAEDLLGHARSDEELAAALTTIGIAAWTDGRVADAVAFLRAAVERADREPLAARHMRPRQSLAVMLCALGEFDDAAALLERDRDAIGDAHDPTWSAGLHAWQSRLLLSAGRLHRAASSAKACIDVSSQPGVSLFLPLAWSTLAAVRVMQGDLDAADVDLEASPATSADAAAFVSGLRAFLAARIAWGRENTARSLDLMDAVYADPAANVRLFLEEPGCAPWLVSCAVELGDPGRGEAIARTVDGVVADNEGFDGLTGIALHVRAVMRRDSVALDEAARHHRHPWARALALEHCGRSLARRDHVLARVSYERAIAVFAGMGAVHDARRVRSALDQLTPRGRSQEAERPGQGWQSLTAAEQRVVDFVVQGLTNAEVADAMGVSRHTVDFHLRHVFRKLDVNSRVALTRLVLDGEA
jgi:DNA-binding CsgD family transcriptional regulator